MKNSYVRGCGNYRLLGLLLIMILPFVCGNVMAVPPPTINNHPSNTTVCAGGNTSFTVSATGATAYQWQVNQGAGFVNASGGVYSGVNTPTLTITGATASMNGYIYRVVVTGTPQPRNSDPATLTVNSPPSTSNPSNRTVCAGTEANFSVTATGAGLSYQWQVNQGSGFTNLSASGMYSGVNGPALGIMGTTSSMNGYQYRVIVNGTCPPPDTSNAATLTVISISTTGTQTNVSCNGQADGSATVNATGGVTPYTYAWAPSGGTSATAMGLAAGTYTVTVTDAIGCTATRTYTITQPPALTTSGSQTNASCYGSCDGSASVTPSGGTPGYTYSWYPSGETGSTASNLCAGSYTVSVRDTNECTTTRTYTITQPPLLSISSSVTHSLCNGDSAGSIDVTITGGTGSYSFSWSNGDTTEDVSGLPAGSYTLTVTDGNSCMVADTIVVTQPSSLMISAVITNVSCYGDSTGGIDVTIHGGTSPYSFSWSNGSSSEDQINLAAGDYILVATDSNGCSLTDTMSILQPLPLLLSSVVTNVLCYGDSSGMIDITITGGIIPYTYVWSNGDTIEDALDLPSGQFIVSVTDSNGCSVSDTFNITEPAPFIMSSVITNVSCNGDSTGSIDLTLSGGTSPYTFSWNTGATTEDISGLQVGVYTVIIIDSNSCTIIDTFMISQPTVMMISTTITNVGCNGDSTGAIDITVSGGVAPYEFSWSNGEMTEDIQGLAAGAYVVMVTDSNGCMLSDTFNIIQPAMLSVSAAITNVACNGDSTGAIDITVSGGTVPYSFNWSTGDTTEDVSGRPAGDYMVTVADSNSCMITDTFTIMQAVPLLLSGIVTHVACSGDSSGTIDITISGGTAPYSFSWSTGDTTEDVSGLPAGDYMVTVTDSNSCMITDTFTIMNGVPLSLSGVVTHVACSGDSTGAIDLTVSGGAAPYSFLWSNGETTEDISGLAASDYMVTVTDSNGCMIADTFTVTQPTGINISGSITHVDCSGDSTGVIDITVSGGTAPYSFSWSNSTSIEDIANIPAGTYVITITDSNSCTVIDTFIVIPLDSSLVGINAPDTVCLRSAPIILTANPPGGIFSGGGVNGNIFDPTVSDLGTFVITYTYEDTSACNSGTIIVTDTINVVLCNGIEENGEQASLILSPNPASGQFIVSMSNVSEPGVRIRIHSIDGRLVIEENVQAVNKNMQRTIDASGLSTGIYSVQVIAGSKVFNERIIIR